MKKKVEKKWVVQRKSDKMYYANRACNHWTRDIYNAIQFEGKPEYRGGIPLGNLFDGERSVAIKVENTTTISLIRKRVRK